MLPRVFLRKLSAFTYKPLFCISCKYPSYTRTFCTNEGASTSSTSKERYDIVIIGGGMVGNAMACSLGTSKALQEKSVLLLEAGKPQVIDECPADFSNRVSAIAPASRRLFEKLGIWKRLAEDFRVQQVKQLQVRESRSQSHIHFEWPDFHGEVAHIIENRFIVSTLLERLLEKELTQNIAVRTAAKVKDCRLPFDLSEPAEVELEDGSVFETSLLIGADGFNSSVRMAIEGGADGVESTSFVYGQTAIVATLKLAEPCDNNVAFQRFAPRGPIAVLPLDAETSSLVWTTSEEEAKRLLLLDDETFVDELNHAMWTEEVQDSIVNGLLETVDNAVNAIFPLPLRDSVQLPPTIVSAVSGSRAGFPLGFIHPDQYIAPRAALVGDAAHRVHPLAGQGVNLGFADVTQLTEVLENGVGRGADLGSTMLLRDYDSTRQRQNVPIMLAIDALNRIYQYQSTPVVALRSLGVYAFNKLTPLKKQIMQHTNG